MRFGPETWSYASLERVSGQLAGALRSRGVQDGHRIGLFMTNCPAWLAWFFAISRVGGVAVPMNPAYTGTEISSILEVSDLRVLICEDRLACRLDGSPKQPQPVDVLMTSRTLQVNGPAAMIEPAASPDPTAPAVIFFSSGSTGMPKGIVHSGRNLVRIVQTVSMTWPLRSSDGLFVAMPLAFVYASIVECLTAIRVGATVELQERFDPDATVARLAAGKITSMMGVPSMYRMLLATREQPGESGKLRFCATAGETLEPTLSHQFGERFSCPLLDFYGLTEAPHIIAHSNPAQILERPLSCGRVLTGVEARVVDDHGQSLPSGETGELVVRAPWMFDGYFRDPVATKAVLKEGWFWTGDLTRRDAEEYVYIVERKKELIKRSGFNVFPAEVERVIREVPGIAEVAVVGVADTFLGERVKAWIVPRPGVAVNVEQVLAACRAKLASYKVPDVVEELQELPKGPTGKIDRKELRH